MKKKHKSKVNTTTDKIEVRFDLKDITLYGGAVTILDYIIATRLKEQFKKAIPIEKRSDSVYPIETQLTVIIAGKLVGLERIYHFSTIERDPIFCKKLNLEKLPDYTLLYKDLERFDKEEKVKGLEEILWSYAQRNMKDQEYIILDMDSTVEIIYGEQEGAEIGYNPMKQGRRSYHPLLFFDGISKSCLKGVLRSGNSHVSDGVREAYNEIKKRLKHISIRYIRGDEGFGGEENFSFWEGEEVGYAIKTKTTQRLIDKAKKEKFHLLWEDEEKKIEATSIIYKATSWEKARRVVVIRKKLKEVVQGVLWEELLYEYEAIVTNLDWQEEDIYKFYNQRANCENMVKECKRGFDIDKISTDGFYPNYADFLLKLIAYNIFCAFKKETFPQTKKRLTIDTVRRMFFLIPAILVYHARRCILRLSLLHPWIKEWFYIREKSVAIGYS